MAAVGHCGSASGFMAQVCPLRCADLYMYLTRELDAIQRHLFRDWQEICKILYANGVHLIAI